VQLFYTDVFVLPLPPGTASRWKSILACAPPCSPAATFPRAISTCRRRQRRGTGRAHDPDYIRQVSCGQLSEQAQKAIGFPVEPRHGRALAPLGRGNDLRLP
jgi:hypothetical protein